MNSIFFGLKRAFHGALAVTRKRLQAVSPGMTAARFDMMYLLAGGRDGRQVVESFYAENVLQCVLGFELGVSRPVVARMLRSLEKLGWVKRRRWEHDGRYRVVTLTFAGLQCVRAAFQQVVPFSRGVVHRAMGIRPHRAPAPRLQAIVTLDRYLKSLREHCRNHPGRLWYWWLRPDG